MPPARPNARVLILSQQPLVAALLGMMLELEQFEPAFAQPGEGPEDALARLRPLLVILLDGDLEAARSDLFFARAARRGVRVILFSPPGSEGDVEALAEGRSVGWFTLPIDRSTLARLIGDGSPRTRSGGDRRVEGTSWAADGTLIYDDASGRRWYVYDRRAGDRRAGASAAPGQEAKGDYRAFVSGSGEEWRIPFDGSARLEITATALGEQLARATLVVRPG